MSTHREIEEAYKDEIIKKSKMVKFTGENVGDMEGELNQASFYHESVYFILDAKSNAVKIGTSHSVEERMIDIQVGNPNKLRVIAVIPQGDSEQGNIEKELHGKFKHLRMRGEWFKYDGELKSFIKNLP